MDKAQGALEYLLLVGGAVLVVTISLVLVLQLTTDLESGTSVTAQAALDITKDTFEEKFGGGSECSVDADCSDEFFCNGVETCSAGVCVSGSDLCAAGETISAIF